MFTLGMVLANGSNWGLKQNMEEAIKWLQLASDKGDLQSQIELDFLKYYGVLETPDSRSQGLKSIISWAEKGYKRAQLGLARGYVNGHNGMTEPDLEKAFFWAKKAAKEKDPMRTGETEPFFSDAQFLLGRCYEKGWGVKKNNKLTFKHTLLAAEQGHSHAQHALGLKYRQGIGVKKDLKKSFTWVKESARKLPEGEMNLGTYYLNGIGTDVSYEKAYEYYKKS